jgi:signal transduction histidine kinase
MLFDDMRGLGLLSGMSDERLHQLVDAGEEVHFEAGDVLFEEADPAEYWWLLLEGRVDLLRRTGRDETILRAMEEPGQWAGGFRAWDDASGYLATGRAATAVRQFRIRSADLGALAREWFPFGVHLINGFFQTVRRMDSLSRERESLIALGRLSAGLAHEINNPASAAARAIDALEETTESLLSSLTHLGEDRLSAEAFVELDALRRELGGSEEKADPLALSDREDRISTWMDDHGLDEGWRIAPALAAGGADVEWCDQAAAVLGGDTLEPGLEWVASVLATRALLAEAKDATARVSTLVGAMKSHSHRDQASMQTVDITEGLESSLVMLGHKIGTVEVVRDYAADVPPIQVDVAEINHVWMNLIENAIDAMEGEGTLRITTRSEPNDVVVEIADTGGGMPPEVQARAFDPFFTTKDVGKGSGLGLDIARRVVVDEHRGEIRVASSDAGTTMSVSLPLHP